MTTAMTLNTTHKEFLAQWKEWIGNVEAVYCPNFTEQDYTKIENILESVLEFGPEVKVIYLDYIAQAEWRTLSAFRENYAVYNHQFTTSYSINNSNISPAIVYKAVEGCLEFTVVGNLLGLA
jgi:RNA-binding protein YlmH